MRYTTLKITFTTLIFCVSFYMQGQTLTLQECVELALEKNITIKQSELDIANAELDKSNAFGNFLPNINAQTSHSWNIGLNQNITTGLLENLTTQFSSLGVNMGVDIYNGLQNVKFECVIINDSSTEIVPKIIVPSGISSIDIINMKKNKY